MVPGVEPRQAARAREQVPGDQPVQRDDQGGVEVPGLERGPQGLVGAEHDLAGDLRCVGYGTAVDREDQIARLEAKELRTTVDSHLNFQVELRNQNRPHHKGFLEHP
jgi:hypothetical protein